LFVFDTTISTLGYDEYNADLLVANRWMFYWISSLELSREAIGLRMPDLAAY